MTHPTSCANPDTCPLTYREHLLGVAIAAAAMPTRAIHRTPGQPDEPAWRTEARERRWEKDLPAFKRLHDAGHETSIDGAAKVEQELGG